MTPFQSIWNAAYFVQVSLHLNYVETEKCGNCIFFFIFWSLPRMVCRLVSLWMLADTLWSCCSWRHRAKPLIFSPNGKLIMFEFFPGFPWGEDQGRFTIKGQICRLLCQLANIMLFRELVDSIVKVTGKDIVWWLDSRCMISLRIKA